jgi:hypothetical protein
MKGKIQIEILVSLLPTLQYSSTPEWLTIFTGNPATGGTDLAEKTSFWMLNKKCLTNKW